MRRSGRLRPDRRRPGRPGGSEAPGVVVPASAAAGVAVPASVAAGVAGPASPLPALYGVAFLFRAAQNVAQTSLAPIGESDLHLRAAVVGGIIALSGVVTVASTVLLGRMASTGAVRRWMGVGLVVTAGAFPVVAAAPNGAVLALGGCLLGAGGGLTMPSLSTLVGHGAARSARRALAGLAVALSVSLSLGPLADSAILGATGNSLRLALVGFGALPLLAAALVFVTRRPAGPPPAAGAARHRSDAPTGVGAEDAPPAAAPADVTGGSGRPGAAAGGGRFAASPWRRPGWRLATTGQLLYQVPFVAVVSFGVVAGVRLYGLSPAGAQLAITTFFAVSLVTRVVLTAGVEVHRPRRAVLLVAVLTVAGVTLLAAGRSSGELFVALGVLGLPHGLVYPVALGLIADETPTGQLSRANAAFSAWSSGVTVVLPAVLGGLIAAGGLRVMFIALLVPVIALAVAVTRWPAPPPRAASSDGCARRARDRHRGPLP